MTWYSGATVKPLEKLLTTYPTIQQLLSEPDFLTQLKAFNSKLLQYITNHPELIKQAIEIIIIPPKQSDSSDRKYKYPLLAIQMIQTQATCIMNGLFKQMSPGRIYLDLLFQILDQKNILLISAGYFFRVNHCLLNLRFKQITQFIYTRPEIFKKLLQHTYNISITNVIQLFLNLDASKVDRPLQQRKNLKVQLIWAIMAKIDQQKYHEDRQSIQNLSNILLQIVQKYYLISDGKALLDPILTSKSVGLFLELSTNSNPLISLSILNLLVCIINYYSFSSYNSEDKSNEQYTKKNFQKLESQPLINGICLYFQKLLSPLINSNSKINLYNFKILQFLCHSVSLCSNAIFNTIKRTNFLEILLDLLFKFQNNNILHTLIQRTFLCIFVTQKKFYQQYKVYIFCQMNIIQKTVNRIIGQKFQGLKAKGYFGHLMRIIKIYSSIQTTNDSIINKIRESTQIWSKITKQTIKPYQQICFKDLGSYDINIVVQPIQYKVKQLSNIIPSKGNTPKYQLIQKYSDQQYSQFLKPHNNSFQSNHDYMTQGQNNKFFKIPIQEISIVDRVLQDTKPTSPATTSSNSSMLKNKQQRINPRKQQNNYNDFMNKKKNQAQQQIRLQKSLSNQKKATSPTLKNLSPKKYNAWQKKEESMPVRQKSPVPTKKSISQSMIMNKQDSGSTPYGMKNSTLLNSNNFDIQKLKIKIIDVIPMQHRKFRKIDQKDMVLLNFLGIYK